MPFELIKTDKETYEIIGRGTTQVLLEGDIIVPDIKPDIAEVLRVAAQPYIEEEKAAEDRVGFKGGLHLNIIYEVKKAEKPVHSMQDTLTFEDFINIDGVTRLSDVQTRVKLTHLEYKLINDRKISVKAIITVSACAWQKETKEILQDAVGDGLQLKTCTVAMNKCTNNKKDRFVIKEQLTMERSKPDIAQLLDSDVTICQKEVKAINGGVSVKGEAAVSLLYTGEDQESIVELGEFWLPFNGVVEIDGVTQDMYPHADLTVKKIDAYVLPNDDGEDRVVDVEITVQAVAGAEETSMQEFITDAYATNGQVELETEDMEYQQMVGRNTTRANIKQNLTLENGLPDIMQVVKAWGVAMLDDTVVAEDRVNTDGAVALQVMYIAEDDDSPVEVVEFLLPFEQTIEVMGAKAGDEAEVNVSVEKILINMLSGQEIEANVTLIIETNVTRKEKQQVISNIEEAIDSEPQKVYSVVVYVVQKGDTLWSIAKKYNTTVNDILIVNDIEMPDCIYPGEKLLIIRRM
jgi:FOG: LysM repeat